MACNSSSFKLQGRLMYQSGLGLSGERTRWWERQVAVADRTCATKRIFLIALGGELERMVPIFF